MSETSELVKDIIDFMATSKQISISKSAGDSLDRKFVSLVKQIDELERYKIENDIGELKKYKKLFKYLNNLHERGFDISITNINFSRRWKVNITLEGFTHLDNSIEKIMDGNND